MIILIHVEDNIIFDADNNNKNTALYKIYNNVVFLNYIIVILYI